MKNDWINAKPVVLRYRIDLEKIARLESKIFEKASLEWGHFIYENRRQAKTFYDLPYDYAIGPVADGFMRRLIVW